jgi:hypothetical protein
VPSVRAELSTHLTAEQALISYSSERATFSIPRLFIHNESPSDLTRTRSIASPFQTNLCG